MSTFHAQRDRAESFGAVAELYDRFRPDYADQLIRALVALRPAHVLDIGCGTGKAARQLAARGLDVLGVEIDADMAEIARRHGVSVEVSPFETWDDRGRTFDLIVSGQAWHWVDPEVGAPKLVRLLRPGGVVCLLWNYEEPDEATQQVVDEVYRRLAPEVIEGEHGDDVHGKALRRTGCFGSVRSERYERAEQLSIDAWIGRVSTYSRHLLLGPRLAEVQDALRAALHDLGDTVHLAAGTYAVWARP
ncbi:MAG TPA: class I SAM-dependent methyltransferase [Jatrophihabitans sp.]|nr:class I SAM-dependent methyltransferase [Jatrophihabitans sp.]